MEMSVGSLRCVRWVSVGTDLPPIHAAPGCSIFDRAKQELLAGMKEKWRYNIGLAGRKKVQVREATGRRISIPSTGSTRRPPRGMASSFIPKSTMRRSCDSTASGTRRCLLLAEYEERPIAGLIAVRCGPVTTYMFGASSNAERNRMPNHLLQWTAIRWAKAHGCTIYDFRAIAEVLDPGEDLYSLFTYKQGYGGYSTLSLETHDLPYNAAAVLGLSSARWR